MKSLHVADEKTSAKPTVLVVEDVGLLRLVVADSLRQYGFVVVEASNTDEAIRVLGTQGSVDIVFSDINMPEKGDGFALARWVGENLRGVKVVLGSGDADTAEAAAASHYDEPIIPKPYDYAKLAKHLHAQLETMS